MDEKIKKIQNGEKYLLNDLIKDNMDYIYSFTKKYYNIFDDYEDLIQEAIIAFIDSVYKYDFKKNFLNPFASIRIYYRISKYIYENLTRITCNEDRFEIAKKAYEKCKKTIGHSPNYSELTLYYRIDRSHAIEIINIYKNNNTYQNILEYKDYYEDFSLEDIERNINSDNLINIIKNSSLTLKQQDVILTKFGFIDGNTYTFETLAQKRNLKKQATHYLYKKAEKKLKRILNYY